MRSKTSGSIMLGIGALALLGCGAEELVPAPDRDDDALAQPVVVVEDGLTTLAELDVGDTKVTFYEPEAGTIVMTELGKVGTDPVLASARGERPLDIYEQFSGQRAPAALVQAQRIVDELATLEPPRVVAAPTADDEEASAASARVPRALADDEWFWANYCGNQQNEFYKEKRWRAATSNEVDFQIDDIYRGHIAVMSLEGTIKASFKTRSWYTWSGATRVELPKGYYYDYLTGGVGDYDIKAYIYEASGNTYDACGYGHRSRIPI